MNFIKSMKIQNFKKFENLSIDFNPHLNILVGGNEAGKSTILEAIQLVLNQTYKNADRSILKELFRQQQIIEFELNPSPEVLPAITIELELNLDESNPKASYFYGSDTKLYDTKEDRYGIRFSCFMDTEADFGIDDLFSQSHVPYEFYSLEWKTFAGRLYQTRNSLLKLLAIDTSRGAAGYSFNYFNKSLFNNKFEEADRSRIKHKFNSNIEGVFDNLNLDPIGNNRVFGIDTKKLILENLLSIYDDGIPLEKHGSGMENLVKTQIALEKSSQIDVILLEEPENHLGFPELKKMVHEISTKKDESQIILATHNSMIASGLDLRNLMWIKNSEIGTLAKLDSAVSDFFVKSPDNSILQLLLSERVLLVEGAAEKILMPRIYELIYKRNIETDKITVISCNGLSFERYLSVAAASSKKVAVLTDNDKSQKKINKYKNLNEKDLFQKYFFDESLDNWTFEVCMYHENKKVLDNLIETQKDAKYEYHGQTQETPTLGKMLNEKAETAYKLLTLDKDFSVPEYIRKALEWLNE